MKTSQNSIPNFKREQRRQQLEIKRRYIHEITYDADYNLESFHGFKVGSYVQLCPQLMEIFVQNLSQFSDTFLKKYSSGVFQVSYFQGPVLFEMVEHEKLGLVMENDKHRTEFMKFLSNYAIRRTHSHSQAHQYVSTDYRNLIPHFAFQKVHIPTHTLP